ncbi:MAG: UDP-N-acetylmuramoyl-L-alanine--D-glutamate ligase [Planctomicrobium sp.]|nr:UDP-N-acetylmuramoyl-L-alanine--D-glutamate ligase [Planctomicrobium sp.]
MNTTDFKNRRVTVMGLGRFGGGIGVVNFLLQQGARVTLTDLQREGQLKDSLSKIDVSRLDQLVLGEHRERDFVECDCVVINPGIVADKNRFIRAAVRAGVPVTTEINLFWDRCRAKVIIVTGTVGKSTTSSLITHLLKHAGVSCHLGGNIGISLLSKVETFTEDDWVVLELSSFQLEYLKPLQPRPNITVVTNFFANHIDWHGDLDSYRTAKQVALNWQTPDGVAVLNANDPDVRQWKTKGKRIEFGSQANHEVDRIEMTPHSYEIKVGSDVEEIPYSALPARLNLPHQRANIAAALAAVLSTQTADPNTIMKGLSSFRPLPHRLELIADREGIEYINDSKATTPEATMAALSSMTRPVVLIAGGKDKRIDVSELCRSISGHVKAVALIGDTSLLMALLLPEYRKGLLYSVHHDLACAYRWCQKQLESGDTLLLSPGCSSDSQFLNYEDRGNQFRQLVETKTNTCSEQSSH